MLRLADLEDLFSRICESPQGKNAIVMSLRTRDLIIEAQAVWRAKRAAQELERHIMRANAGNRRRQQRRRR